MNKRHYEHTLPNIRGSLSNTYGWLRYKIKSHRIINLKHTEYEEDFICSFSCTGNHKLLTE